MVRDVDGVFGRYCTCTYMKKHRFKDITRDAERVMKSKNTQSSLRSPMRLPRNATQEQFDLLQALAHTLALKVKDTWSGVEEVGIESILVLFQSIVYVCTVHSDHSDVVS